MLPTGIVTFLLTDVEGSTALWEDAPEAMRTALARHDVLFEQAVQAHHGIHIRPRGEGDSRFAVFPSATDAVAAALTIQRTFGAEVWPTPRPIKVRIGIHTGEAQLRDDDYYGSAVNRCARIRALGHGRQILLSEATAALVRDDLPADAELLDLGAHRLKDLTRPERIFQPTAPDLTATFPALASVDTHPNNLPVQTTSLIGRAGEVAEVRTLLLREDVRLVTLTGPGGTGKTRLALQVAADSLDDFRDGVYFVDLAPVSDPALIAATIAPVLGVVERGEHVLDDLKRFLRSRSLLLVLDNFEQILAGAPMVGELLADSADLKILVTSRAALQVRGEHEYDVPPLAAPPPDHASSSPALQQYPAVALFVERAQAIRPDFTLTAENGADVAIVCARLDGLPLALELAAARTRLLTPAAMVARLERRLPLLSSGPRDLPARHQALRDTIAWSYELLDPDEQRTFRGLGVFVGGFTLEAAESVIGGDEPPFDVLGAVERLVAQSLVRPDPGDGREPRFRMLETIREYALDRLEAERETASLRDRHLAWHVDLAERGIQQQNGPAWGGWLDRFEAEHDNLRAALAWSEQSTCAPETGLRLARALAGFWLLRGHHRVGRAWLARTLARAPARTANRAAALANAGFLAVRQNDYDAATPYMEEALTISRELGDRRSVAQTLLRFGVIPHHQGSLDRAQAMLEESLALLRELDDPRGVATALQYLADLARDRGDFAAAASAYDESLALARQHENHHGIAYSLRGLGHLARSRGEYARASRLLAESLTLLKGLRDRRCIPLCLEGIACIEVGPHWAERAVRMLAAAQTLQSTTGAPAPPAEMADHRRTEADARAQLGEERFAAAWAAGAGMSLDEAVAFALQANEPAAPPDPEAVFVGPDRPDTTSARRRSAGVGARTVDVPLSAREREVVTLIAQGLSNREIAESLVLSIRTVERHIENVYNRLGISGKAGRAIVTAYALRHGIATSA
jgi:predicted ATPase/class 3 adenylate cyclase/DNA-binding CsgD family transcriptional regulator